MPRLKLSPRSVAVMMPRPGRDEFFDASPSAPRGFGLRVSVRGAAREPART